MKKLTLVAALLASTHLLAACGDDDDDGGNDGVGAGPPAKAFVRVAHLSPDAPAIDFCLAPTGTTTFQGPVFKSLGGATAADGVAFEQVTQYLEVDAVEFDVRLVPPNAADCADTLGLGTFTSLPALPANGYVTVAAIGSLAPRSGTDAPFELRAYVDRRTAPPSGQVAVRFVHASPDTPAVDVGLGSGAGFTPVWTDVAFGAFDSGTGFDANGFLTADALAAGTVLSARATGTTEDALVIELVTGLPSPAIASVFATGYLNPPPGAPALGGIACLDTSPATANLSTCLPLTAAAP
jgi:Domain of unknown function (DUF4397)